MPLEINGQLLYSTTETCKRAGISRATLNRWLQKGVLNKIRRDRRGWKFFTEEDLIAIKTEIEKMHIEECIAFANPEGGSVKTDDNPGRRRERKNGDFT